MDDRFDHFISFIGMASATALSFAVTVMTTFICGIELGFGKFVLTMAILLLVWFLLVYFVPHIRNLAGDLLNKPRCYGCGESCLFRRDVSIPIDDGASVMVCQKCGSHPSRIEPIMLYARLIQAGVGNQRAYDVEKAVVKYKEQNRRSKKRV